MCVRHYACECECDTIDCFSVHVSKCRKQHLYSFSLSLSVRLFYLHDMLLDENCFRLRIYDCYKCYCNKCAVMCVSRPMSWFLWSARARATTEQIILPDMIWTFDAISTLLISNYVCVYFLWFSLLYFPFNGSLHLCSVRFGSDVWLQFEYIDFTQLQNCVFPYSLLFHLRFSRQFSVVYAPHRKLINSVKFVYVLLFRL